MRLFKTTDFFDKIIPEEQRQIKLRGEKMHKQNTNLNGKYQPVSIACGLINVSRNTLMKIATEANAVARFGKTVRIDMPALYEYIDLVYKTGE